jgi:hypothetical protein
MSIDLPLTGHSSARELAAWCSEVQLARAITYLEMVRTKHISPGQEIERLFGEDEEDTFLTWTPEELDAVQRRLALTLCIKRSNGAVCYAISDTIRECVFRYHAEVLDDFKRPRRF